VGKGVDRVNDGWKRGSRQWAYHQQGPDGVVEEDDGRGHEHGEADEFVELWFEWVG
jgi:hypothetical protein